MLASVGTRAKDGVVSTTDTCMSVKFILSGEDDDTLPLTVTDLFTGNIVIVGGMVVVVEVVIEEVVLTFAGADTEYMLSILRT